MKVSREPAFWIGLVGSILTSAAALQLDWLNAGQAAALVAAITGVATAVFTRPVAPALFTGAFAALVALLAQYGIGVGEAQVGFVTTLILGTFAIFGIRPAVKPTTARGVPIHP